MGAGGEASRRVGRRVGRSLARATTLLAWRFDSFLASCVARERIRVIPPGVNLAGHSVGENDPQPTGPRDKPITVGYLSRIGPEKGLHLLAEAFILLARDKEVPACDPGDLLAVMSAGAYGFSMASNYNSRPRAAEIMVSGDRFFVIRDRETYETLIQGESIPPFLTD